MKFYPTPIAPRFLCFTFFAFMIILSCSKDNDEFEKTVLDESETTVKEPVKEEEKPDVATEEIVIEEETMDVLVEKVYETRTTIFPAINDAHLQGDIGFNENTVRLEEGRRTSYLMFDLSPIDSIGGTVNTTNLEFTIDSDEGNGTVSVYKAISNDWSEDKLTAKTAPETEVLVGKLATQYEVGKTQEVAIDTAFVRNEILTLILTHEQGNDLAFASKENPNGKGPALMVTYSAPQDAEAIVFDKEVETALQADIATDEVKAATEDTAEENTANEESKDIEGVSTEEEAINENVAEEETTVLETTEENTTEEDTTKEESTEVTEDKPQEEGFTVQETTKEETTIEETTTEEETTIEETKDDEETKNQATTEEESPEEEINNEADAPINESPIAVAEASPSNGDAPLKVSFKGNSSSDDLGIKNYVWDFRDGSTSTEANPTHTFEKTGTLEVRLTVTDDQGASHTDTVTITINEKEENKAPNALVSASPTSGEATLEVQFKGSNSNDDTKIEKYFWDFKDGSTTTNANPLHSFSEAGTYEVELSVTDEAGLTDTETVTINVTEIENEAPKAVASGLSLTGDAPLEVQFKASGSNDDNEVTGYFWDFKDGSTTTSKNPSHTFSEPGEYEVELAVKDAEGLTDVTTLKVTVNQRPVDNGDGDSNNTGTDSSGGNSSDGGSDGNTGSNGGSNTNDSNSGNYPSNAVMASSFGFKSGDATAAFEAAINSGSSYVVIDKQSSDWVIRPTRFFDLRNMTIVFEPGVTLRAKPGAFRDGDRLFQLTRAKNVTIEGNGATFRMNKNEYTSGQQRHAFEMTMCNEITVRGLTLRDSGGAGIKISGDNNQGYSQNITLENIRALNNRRDGITITSAQDVWIRNSEFSGSSGAKPESGVVLEADNPRERLVNINFVNCKFSDNNNAGFHFSTTRMNSGSRPVSVKVVDSEFSNNLVSPSTTTAEVYIGGGSASNPVGGEIRFERVRFNGSRARIIFTRKSAEGFKAVFNDCEARNVVSSTSNSPIRLEAHENRNTLGGIEFKNFDIQYNRNMPFMTINAPSKGGSFRVKDVSGSFDIKEPNDNPLNYSGGYKSSENQNVSINYNHN